MHKDYVLDYTDPLKSVIMEMEAGDGGLTYRYVYGLRKVATVIYGIPNGAGSVMQYTNNAVIVKLFHHQERLGVTDYLTDNIAGRITSFVSYDDFGKPTAKAVLRIGVRELDLVQDYTGHPYDMVLGVYYAKARMYNPDNRRFMAVDPIKDELNWYAHCGNNPVLYVDPFGPTSGWDGFHEDFQKAFNTAIRDFQRNAGIEVDGVLNKTTWYRVQMLYFSKLICDDLLYLRLQMPVDSPWSYTSSFGMRSGRMHTGADFKGSLGSNIYAAHSGTVTVKRDRNTYNRDRTAYAAAGHSTAKIDDLLSQGVYMEITSHDRRVVTRYAHLDRINEGIDTGTRVSAGQRIARMGSTGRSTGAHLHFDVIVDGVSRNPWEFLP